MEELFDMSILVVDDDRFVQKMVNALLNVESYRQVKSFLSPLEALASIQSDPPDLVVSDIMMPEMDGYELCKRIRSDAIGRDIPVIIMTSMVGQETLKMSFEAGATDFVSKPINRVEFISRVRSALMLKRSFDQLQKELALRKAAEDRIREQNLNLDKAYGELQSMYETIQRDHDIAQQVLARVAPHGTHGFPNVRAISLPMESVGGDVVLVARRPSGGLNLLLGDLTGHGLSAALGAIPTSDIFNRMTEEDHSIGDIVTEINRKLHSVLPTGLFLCACMVGWDEAEGTATIWNGGLPDVLLVGRDGRIKRRFASDQLPLGVMAPQGFESDVKEVPLEYLDCLYAYSDGVIETRNGQGDLYGQERLEEILSATVLEESRLDAVVVALDAFREGAVREDDIIVAEVVLDTPPVCHPDCREMHRSSPVWQMSVELHPEQMRTDSIELLMKLLTAFWEVRKHKENIFLVLSELYTNALDYGVLRMDSCLKADPAGFVEYHEKRQAALSTLSSGWLKVHFQFFPSPRGTRLMIQLEDSGPGYCHQPEEAELPGLGAFGGRGIPLVRTLCESLVYKGRGNCVEAVYVLS